MLVTPPRLYRQYQISDEEARSFGPVSGTLRSGWHEPPAETVSQARKMLLIHQIGSVRVGEVVRYTVTYTPSVDRIIPSPAHLYVKIKNTSAVALRAAYLHGPYTLYAACYPSSFNPNTRYETALQDGIPQFEPNLKAGGSWNAKLTVPEKIRESGGKANIRRNTDGSIPSATWVIEVTSQVIFSTSATVHFEIIVGRDERSVELGLAALTGASHAVPGQLHDHQQGRRKRGGHGDAHPKGVLSKAIDLVVDDTASLWNKPSLPEWDDEGKERGNKPEYSNPGADMMTMNLDQSDFSEEGRRESHRTRGKASRKRRKVHLVVLTHGLHSNLGADMLYLKESIDAAAKQARIDVRERKAKHQPRAPDTPSKPSDEIAGKGHLESQPNQGNTTATAPLTGGQQDIGPSDEADSDEEEVIVRGFSGNAVRTEKGIQYLGKRLAKYVLSMTYPDQPYMPVKKSVSKSISRVLTGQEPTDVHAGLPSHHNSSIHKEARNASNLAYQITSISFIAHSLGGLTQTYAIAYIYKHSPEFFQKIKPINFVALASPFLGLSNENPIYVKFALNFGLVGRTGQDLGLTWRAPTMVRGGWDAMIGGIGTDGHRAHRQLDPGSKPLLRILPSGPAHQVLKMFRNRTVYSNVVNDGIVPLRTSCLLFLDWRGLGRVEKARRENGLVGTMAGWGWAELTGANSTARHLSRGALNSEDNPSPENSADEGANTPTRQGDGDMVPQPTEDATKDEDTSEHPDGANTHQNVKKEIGRFGNDKSGIVDTQHNSPSQPASPFAGFLSLLRPSNARHNSQPSPKQSKIFTRSQTLEPGQDDGDEDTDFAKNPAMSSRPRATSGSSLNKDPDNVFSPPKTTVFEAAGDILNPPLPNDEFLIDPMSRPRTIFHDRVYHPDDIPALPVKRRNSILRSFSSDARDDKPLTSNNSEQLNPQSTSQSSMKVEEKIARAYHRDLSWRKVLVRLEPDAHNNIVVRRMFANAYGWPVIKHLVDTHFADTFSATTADIEESSEDRAMPIDTGADEQGGEVKNKLQKLHSATNSERSETDDKLSDLRSPTDSVASNSFGLPQIVRADSAQWDDRFFDGTDDDDEEDDYEYDGLIRRRASSESASEAPQVHSPVLPRTTVASTRDETTWSSLGFMKTHEQLHTRKVQPQTPAIAEARARSIILPASSPSMTTMNTSGVGLGKSVEERLASSRLSDDHEPGKT
ncbi:hypothetical protein MMC17_002473 [Xylographa soralifera]|nr:hypothetical protein [Xylographa soralifera]